MKKLSVIILNYNTRNLTLSSVKSLVANGKGLSYEIIVVDNGSKEFFPTDKDYKLIRSDTNLGFARGNNLAKSVAQGEYILFLNSDTLVHKNALQKTLAFIERDEKIGVVTCKLVMPDGKMDPDTRRSFPTPWVAFTHFLYLDKIFPKSKFFSKYQDGYLPENKEAEIDVAQGAFLLTRKKILDKVGWFDEDYFLDGEDIDLCWKIKQEGYKIYYYPEASITHIKKASKKKTKERKNISSGVNAMEIFYRKRLWNNYPLAINLSVIMSIRLIKVFRLVKSVFS